MKTFKNISVIAVFLLLAFGAQTATAGNRHDNKKTTQQNLVTIKGKVIDAETRAPLVFATVAVKETNVAIVTNIDGEFTLKVGDLSTSKTIEVSFVGYKNKSVPLSDLKDNGSKNVIALESAPIPIKEIIVKPLDPVSIVQKAISNIPKNYETVPNLMTAFYRETIRKNHTYVSIGEAVVEIFKAPYNSNLRFDGSRIYKGRKSSDVEKMDTVLFKLQGGPVSVMELDIAKNTESVLTYDAMQYYDYTLSGVVEIDNKPHYVIDFKQKPSVEMPLFMGSLLYRNGFICHNRSRIWIQSGKQGSSSVNFYQEETTRNESDS